jgi:oxygen-independent coproporphyrinogen-3 oxidase
MEAYTKALIEDIRRSEQRDSTVDTVFFGGGTPSMLPIDSMERILSSLGGHFDIDKDAEITMEANPGTTNKEKLNSYRKLGINRLSIGVQSLNDGVLKVLGRIHSAEEAKLTFMDAREAGFDNINLDLMFAVPGQGWMDWIDTLKEAMAFRPEHISFYSLQLEKGTRMFQLFEAGSLDDVDEETDRKMYRTALRMLEREGYLPYEISNASIPGKECRHNLKYWSMEDYLGLGLGAHSFIDNQRFQKEDDITKYRNDPAVKEIHINTKRDSISEFLFTGLRKRSGISLEEFKERFGIELFHLYGKEIDTHRRSELLALNDAGTHLLLTEQGIDVSNRVLSDFV